MFYKNLKPILISLAALFVVALFPSGSSGAGAMEQYCQDFKDNWFSNIVSWDYACGPATSTINAGGAKFEAYMSVGFPYKWTTVKDVNSLLETEL